MAPSRITPDPLPESSLHLTKDQLATWHKQGYLIIPDALAPSTVSSLLNTTHDMLANFSLSDHPMTKFTTGDHTDSSDQETAHVGDDYFLSSGDKVHFFFEEDAFDKATGTLQKPKHLAINKIGHYLHALSPPFADATMTARHAAITHDLGFRDPRVLQSMVICKQPEIGGAVPPHQDSTFLYTDPPSAVGFWYALEDATVENGCLSFLAGSHRREPVKKRFVRAKAGGTTFVDVTGANFAEDVQGTKEDGEVTEGEYELGPVKAGSLVLIHGNLLHKSERNTSGKSRFIYTFHVIEGQHQYDERNWLQPPAKGFSALNEV